MGINKRLAFRNPSKSVTSFCPSTKQATFLPGSKNSLFRSYVKYVILIWLGGILICFGIISGYLDGARSKSQAINQVRRSILAEENQGSCTLPFLPMDNPDISKHFKNVSKIECDPENAWVSCEISNCSITEEAVRRHGSIICEFHDIWQSSDSVFNFSKPFRTKNYYILKEADFAKVKCNATDNTSWRGFVAGIREVSKVRRLPQSPYEDRPMMNVLIFGISSLSRNHFMRKLPKTYAYLTNVLQATVFEGYNIVGDGKAANIIPLLTGQTELELPEARKRVFQSQNVDGFPFIWSKFRTMRYLTSLNEDMPGYATFSYRLKGFKNQPTLHYIRPLYLSLEQNRKNFKSFCMGSIPKHRVMLRYIRDFMLHYEHFPKFSFNFLSELSQNYLNLIGAADDDITNWLMMLKRTNALKNTILIVMSDHGTQYEDIRNTLQGKLEERLPFFSIALPKWFQTVYPERYKNFKNNIKRLSTPFDVHETLLDVARMQNPDLFHFPAYQPGTTPRAISLFEKIPSTRSCADAHIEPHWCSCLSWQSLNHKKSELRPLVDRLLQTALKHINDATSQRRNYCAELAVDVLIWVRQLIPRSRMLKYKKSQDSDGFQGDFSADTKLEKTTYQIKFTVKPSNFVFEANAVHNLMTDSMEIDLNCIYRIDTDEMDSECAKKLGGVRDMEKFCYCVI